jgi:hypothetical protein
LSRVAAFNTTLQLADSVDVVQRRLDEAFKKAEPLSSRQYQVNSHPGLIVIIRRYHPGWAVVLGILGLLLFLIGLLFFLITKTDTLTISLSPTSEGGSTVVVSGEAEAGLIVAVQRALAGASREQAVRDAKLVRLKD